MSQIRMTYEELRAVAADFDNAAQQTEEINARVNSRVSQLEGGWEGIAETAFLQELASCQRQTQRTPMIYAQVAQALRQTADKIEAAEQEAAQAIPGTITADD